MSEKIVQIRGLTKIYGDLYALKRLNLDIEEGSIFGYIGPNGAGKTTTMMILATLLTPTVGKAYVCGVDVLKKPEKIRAQIGFMPDFFGVYDEMKVWEYLDFFAMCYGIRKSKKTGIISDLLELVDLNAKRDADVESLSRGMKQRLGLARTLIHDPKLLILDEPSSGLDPKARIEIKEILKELRKMGKTMLISSHILPDLSEMCTHIGVIEKGELIISGGVQEIINNIHNVNEIEIKIIGDGLEKYITNYPNVLEVIAKEQGNYVVKFNGDQDREAEMLQYLAKNDIKVYSFHRKTANLEDVFMKITKGAVQ